MTGKRRILTATARNLFFVGCFEDVVEEIGEGEEVVKSAECRVISEENSSNLPCGRGRWWYWRSVSPGQASKRIEDVGGEIGERGVLTSIALYHSNMRLRNKTRSMTASLGIAPRPQGRSSGVSVPPLPPAVTLCHRCDGQPATPVSLMTPERRKPYSARVTFRRTKIASLSRGRL